VPFGVGLSGSHYLKKSLGRIDAESNLTARLSQIQPDVNRECRKGKRHVSYMGKRSQSYVAKFRRFPPKKSDLNRDCSAHRRQAHEHHRKSRMVQPHVMAAKAHRSA